MSVKPEKGTFYGGLIEGLEYKTPSLSGFTNNKGEFEYFTGETVTFSLGGLVLGSAPGKKQLTPADLVPEVAGDIKKLTNPEVTNIARLLQCFGKDGNVENGILITEEIRRGVQRYADDIHFDVSELMFLMNPLIRTLIGLLGIILPSGPQARNHLRRTMRGILKFTDVKIPTRDKSYLLADVFRPIVEGKYPVVMSLGAYGKAFWRGVICNLDDQLTHEEWEDKYFEGNPVVPPGPGMGMKQNSECWEIANTADWVPHGYVVIRVDGRGAGNTPGKYEQFSYNEAKDYYDAIEWAGAQPWSNGNVGMFGASYYAIDQYNVAQLQPPSLKAMIPDSGDMNSYRDYIFTAGGLYNTFNFVSKSVGSQGWHGVDWVSVALNNPFDDPAIYGPRGSLCISPDMGKIKTPISVGMGIEGGIHSRASSEAYITVASEHKRLTVISEPPGHGWLGNQYLKEHFAFFDYWLKSIDNGVMNGPPVKVEIRTGKGGSYWLAEKEWPLARTQYTKYYLDATRSSYAGDRLRKDDLRISPVVPKSEQSKSYSGDVKFGIEPPWSYGITFITEPMPEDLTIAGYPKLVLWVSSSTHDMELHCQLRVLDENNEDVNYKVGPADIFGVVPLAHGGLKVSHRKLDSAKSTVYRPYHTHRKKDYQPLKPGEIVECEVEIWPTTAVIRKGWRIRLFVQPASGMGIMTREFDAIDRSYQKGSTYTIYTGPNHPSYIQLPVIPSQK